MSQQGSNIYGTFKDESESVSIKTDLHTHGRGGGHDKLHPHTHTQTHTHIHETLKTCVCFVLWYALNVFYNVDNKIALNMLPLPLTVSTLQLIVGWLWFCPIWLLRLRKVPVCYTWDNLLFKIAPQGVCHVMVHLGAVISFGASAVSFTHIVKAAEPVFTAILSGVCLGQYMSIPTYMTLFPVIFGVALASLKELSFTWTAFWFSMMSNLGSSGRAIFAKKVMNKPKDVGENLTPSNIYAIVTIVATLVAIPLTLFTEAGIWAKVWNESTGPDSPFTGKQIAWRIFISGVWYYSYNEVAFHTLDRVNQVTHAVGNTLKRVVIIVATVVVFRNPVTLMGAVGSAIAIVGTLLYSLSKQKFG